MPSFVLLAESSLVGGDVSGAIAICEEGLASHPDHPMGRVVLGRALLASGRAVEARGQFARALAGAPRDGTLYATVGAALLERGLWRSAARMLERAVELEPHEPEFRVLLSEAEAGAEAEGSPVAGGADAIGARGEGSAIDGGADAIGARGAGSAIAGGADAIGARGEGSAIAGDAEAAGARGGRSALPGNEAATGTGEQGPGVAELPGEPGTHGSTRTVPPKLPPRPPPLLRTTVSQQASDDPLDWLEELPRDTGAPPAPEPTVEEALSAAAAYEQELRERLVGESGSARPPRARNRLGWILGLSLLVAGGTGFGAYEYRRAANREADIARFTAAARNGVLRDTRAAWLATVTALDEVLDRDPTDATARALKALAVATLGKVFGVEGYDPAVASSLLGELEVRQEPEVALATRWVLTEGEAGREALEEEILGLPQEKVGAPVHSLAGLILLDRGNPAGAIERFNQAIAALPSHVPTLVRVADYYRSRGEHGEALRYYELALAVAEDHPTAVLGAAEARLALGTEVPGLKGALSALDKAGAPASFPQVSRIRRAVVRARLLAALDRREEALAELDSTRPDPSDPQRMASVALAFVQVGAPERAEALIGKVQADSALALREARARSLLAQERYKLLESVPVGAGERQLHLLKGIALYQLGQWSRARTALRATGTEQGGRLPADAVVYLALIDRATGRGDRGRATLERLGASPRARTAARWAWASVLRDEGRWDEAEDVLSEAIARDPQGVEPHCALGRLLLGRGDRKGAQEALQTALRLNPHHSEARIGLARLALEAGAWEAAGREIDQVFTVRQDLPEAWAARALWLRGTGEAERAQRAAERATALGRHNALASAAAAAIARDQGEYLKAARSAKAAVAADPNDVSLWLELGTIERHLGNWKAAGQAFQRALALAPGSAEARWGASRVLLEQGKIDEAVTLLDEALQNLREPGGTTGEARLLATRAWAVQLGGVPGENPDPLGAALELLGESVDVDVALIAANVYRGKGEHEEAAALLEKARVASPLRPDLHLARARQFRDRDDDARAKDAYRSYLEVAPNGAAAAEARKAAGGRGRR